MSEIEINAAQAGRELRLTEAAFAELRASYVEEAVRAKEPAEAMMCLAAVKMLDSVRMRLLSHTQTLEIEQAVQANKT